MVEVTRQHQQPVALDVFAPGYRSARKLSPDEIAALNASSPLTARLPPGDYFGEGGFSQIKLTIAPDNSATVFMRRLTKKETDRKSDFIAQGGRVDEPPAWDVRFAPSGNPITLERLTPNGWGSALATVPGTDEPFIRLGFNQNGLAKSEDFSRPVMEFMIGGRLDQAFLFPNDAIPATPVATFAPAPAVASPIAVPEPPQTPQPSEFTLTATMTGSQRARYALSMQMEAFWDNGQLCVAIRHGRDQRTVAQVGADGKFMIQIPGGGPFDPGATLSGTVAARKVTVNKSSQAFETQGPGDRQGRWVTANTVFVGQLPQGV